MFYRRKVILALLQAFNGRLDKINLYKLLLILSKRQVKPEYEFIPYKFGCYSFSLHADLVTMYKKGLLKDEDTAVSKIETKNYFSILSEQDKKIIIGIQQQFANSTADDLMRYTYINYPETAINSLTAERLLTSQQLDIVTKAKSASDKSILYTIGYEGISLEGYLNKLLQNNVAVLVDVRNNPMSMKFGFSKSQLKTYCNNIGIDYLHIPQVGIQSALRQELITQADYEKLFSKYRSSTLQETNSYQEQILSLIKKKQRIALTCFEANICQCHRKHLAEAITQLPGWNFELKHI